jgi:hypothetical protein
MIKYQFVLPPLVTVLISEVSRNHVEKDHERSGKKPWPSWLEIICDERRQCASMDIIYSWYCVLSLVSQGNTRWRLREGSVVKVCSVLLCSVAHTLSTKEVTFVGLSKKTSILFKKKTVRFLWVLNLAMICYL